MDAPTDEKLLAAYLNGDVAAFELLVRRYTDELYRFALRVTHNGAAAEDVVQETFLTVSLSGKQFDGERRFRPWVFTIAANKARDWLRKRNRHREVPLELRDQDEAVWRPQLADLLTAETGSPQRRMGVAETRRHVRGIVQEMPRDWYEVLMLAYYHRFAYRDIAEIVGIPIGTVKSRLHAAVAYFGTQYRAAVHDGSEGGERGGKGGGGEWDAPARSANKRLN